VSIITRTGSAGLQVCPPREAPTQGDGDEPFASNLLGDAAIPSGLWIVVFAAAFMPWALAEATARLVWRETAPDETSHP
jgi:hypothetical protein